MLTLGAKNKKKKKPSTFEEIYAATRREWPDGMKPYTRVFKDKRKEQKNARLGKNDLMEYEKWNFDFSEKFWYNICIRVEKLT